MSAEIDDRADDVANANVGEGSVGVAAGCDVAV